MTAMNMQATPMMFKSVLDGGSTTSRFGRGAIFSTVVHVSILALSIYIGSRPAEPRKDHRDLTFVIPVAAPPPVAPSPPPPPPSKESQKVERNDPAPPKRPNTIVESKEQVEDRPVDIAAATPNPASGNSDQGNGMEGGVVSDVKTESMSDFLQDQVPLPPPPQNMVFPFGAGMSRPSMLSGRDPEYTKEALAARVEGTMIVRCTITTSGSITNCNVLKSLPHMDQEVVSALQARTYTPVLFQGRPVAVDYKFYITLVLPSR